MISADMIATWPGKSARENDIEHPAIYHMLDVAAVAEVLLDDTPLSRPCKDALALLVALHDIGKVSDSFRNMLRGTQGQVYSHWELTEIHLNENADILLSALEVKEFDQLAPLIGATAGHHGRPSKLTPQKLQRAKIRMSLDAKSDARTFIAELVALWPNSSLAELTTTQAQHLSWWLSGLVTTADWIGSNPEWFSPKAAGRSLGDYLQQAREVARQAVCSAGLASCSASDNPVIDWASLRPMQSACRDVSLTKGPMLAVIEDETGAGKTEAALMLAQRMLKDKKGEGLFFALPTMATADAMFARVSKSIGKMFAEPPTVTLAHGRAGLSEDFNDIRIGGANAPEDVGCTEWLGENRRRSLLATVGVGTIDQALLSVLPVKFQTLRHYALSSKILIVDEVHELGEPYIAVTLANLLRLHRNAGGSAILLTATLPLHLRQSLLAVYDGSDDCHPAYPALTLANGSVRRDLPTDTGPKGAVSVERLASSDVAVNLIREKAAQGAACVWIRNAVDEAIAAVDALRAVGVPAELLHARFALGDRKRHEKAALERFGRAGVDRAGRVLVGTQVLESSLDLDFDVMVSDLAPMAALVQRAGRLWRHMDVRPAEGRPVSKPVLYVLSPDPADVVDEYWLTGVLGKGAYPYPADLMWRTAHHLFDVGAIVAPSGIRSLIEKSYAELPELPAPLAGFEIQRLGNEQSHSALAWQNVVDIDCGYRAGGQALDDANYPTRLGQDQRTLLLVRLKAGRLTPIFDGAEGLAMAEVSVAARKLNNFDLPLQDLPEIAEMTKDWPDWKKAAVTVCPVSGTGEICEGLRYIGDYGLIL